MTRKPKWVVSVEDANVEDLSYRRVFSSELKAYKFAGEVIADVLKQELENLALSIEAAPEEETPGEHSKESLTEIKEGVEEILKGIEEGTLESLQQAVYDFDLDVAGDVGTRVSVEEAL